MVPVIIRPLVEHSQTAHLLIAILPLNLVVLLRLVGAVSLSRAVSSISVLVILLVEQFTALNLQTLLSETNARLLVAGPIVEVEESMSIVSIPVSLSVVPVSSTVMLAEIMEEAST